MIVNRLSRRTSLLYTLFAAIRVYCIPVTATIDDTSSVITYSPANQWSQGGCSGCTVHLDTTQVFNGTWHETTHITTDNSPYTITIPFTGTGIQVYNALANSVANALTTVTNLVFQIDDGGPVPYQSTPTDSTDYDYSQVVFQEDGLDNATHTLVISAPGGQDSLVLFDRVVYTFDNGNPSDPPPPPPPSTTSSSDTVTVTQTQIVHFISTTTAITTSVTSQTPSSSSSLTSDSTKTANNSSTSTLPVANPTSPPSSVHDTPSNSTTSSTSSASTAQTTTPDSVVHAATSKRSAPLGVIIGAAGGGIAAPLILAVIAFFCCRRRVQRSALTAGFALSDKPRTEETMESNRGVGRHTAYHSGSDITGSEPNSATSLIHIREGTVNPETLSRSSTVDSFLSQSRRATTSWSSDELPARNMPLRPLRRQQSVERGPTVQYSPEEDETVQAAVEGEHATLLRPFPPTVSSANATASGEASSAASEAHPPSVENQELREQMARLQDEIERLRRIQEMQAILEDAPPMYDPSSAPRRQS